MSDEHPQSSAPAAVDEPAHADDPARDELVDELARMEDRYRRALADLDNLRKRTTREIERRVEESREVLLREWLEAVDSVERAIGMTPAGPVREGLDSVLNQMELILARHGVERMGHPGDRFDPERHEAVGVAERDDVEDRTVVAVVRSGYVRHERVLRPAQVIVSRRPQPGS